MGVSKSKNLMIGVASFMAFQGSVPVEAAGQEPFTHVPAGSYKAYLKPGSLPALQEFLPEIASVAKKDIIFIEPSHLAETDIDRFFNLPVISELYSAKPGGLLKKKSKDIETVQILIFADLLTKLENSKDGKNYLASSFNGKARSVCLVIGDLNVNPVRVAQSLGSIPDRLITDQFRTIFSDKKSLLTFVLLHEAHHCNQKGMSEANLKGDTEEILRYEIDSDRVATRLYKEMLLQGEELDPAMPEKIKSIRLLQPVMQTSARQMAVEDLLSNNHATAEGIENEKILPMDISKASVQFSLIVKSVLYESLSEAEKTKYENATRAEIEKSFVEFKQDLDVSIAKEQDPQAKQQLLEIGNMIGFMKPILINLNIANQAQRENPDLLYRALKIMASGEFDSPAQGSVSDKAAKALQAYSLLGIAEDEQGYQNFLQDSAIASKKPPSFSQLSIMNDITKLQQMGEKAFPVKPVDPSPEP